MPGSSVAVGVLESWKEIAAYLGKTVRTAKRWEQKRGLPVRRVPGGGRQVVFAYRQEIDEWLLSGSPEEADLTPSLVPSHFPSQSPLKTHSLTRRAVWVALFITGLAAFSWVAFRWFETRTPSVAGLTQITATGTGKLGLVTDGKTVYFGDRRNGKVVVASISADGGDSRALDLPIDQAIPADISRDGKTLLLLSPIGYPTDAGSSLWSVPVIGGSPRHLGQIICQDAVWSPDGTMIAYGIGNTLNVAHSDGTAPQKLAEVAGVVVSLRWSPDGRFIRVQLRDTEPDDLSFWDVYLTSGVGNFHLASIRPVDFPSGNIGPSWTLDEHGTTLAAITKNGAQTLLRINGDSSFWHPHLRSGPLTSSIEKIVDLALSPNSNRLFALGGRLRDNKPQVLHWQRDMLKIDPRVNEFSLFLPGIPRMDVDFSRDGKQIAYSRLDDWSIWISKPDGTAARRLTESIESVELPRWSPDGKWIAFLGKLPGRPFRIYIVSSTGGAVREAATGEDNQGAPTWSPDGKWIVHGEVKCQEEDTCTVRKINIATGKDILTPGSEGLSTARMSPDGSMIAALNADRKEVELFNVKSEQWRAVAKDITGEDLVWSPDSVFLYASSPVGDSPRIVRIEVKTDRISTAVELKDVAKLNGKVNTWFNLAPDGSFLIVNDFWGNEIYSMEYQEK